MTSNMYSGKYWQIIIFDALTVFGVIIKITHGIK